MSACSVSHLTRFLATSISEQKKTYFIGDISLIEYSEDSFTSCGEEDFLKIMVTNKHSDYQL